MTKTIINVTKTVFSLGLLSILGFSTLIAQARPASVSANTVTISVNRTSNFSVYFKYGFSNTDIGDLNDVVVEAGLSNPVDSTDPSIELVPTGAKDIFNGDPGTSTATAPVAPTTCDANFESNTPGYEIPEGFFSPALTRLNAYGLQTAKNGATANGILRSGRTGCIKLNFKLKTGAQVGDRALITFDWDAGRSTSITEDQRPPIQLVPLVIGDAVSSSAQSTSVSMSSSVPPSSSSRSSSSLSSVTSSSRVSNVSSSSSSSVVAVDTTSRTGGGAETLMAVAVISLVGGTLFVIKGISSSKTKID